MSDNVIEFKPKETPAEHLTSIHVYIDINGQFEVNMEINDNYDDDKVFEAIMATAYKFANEMDLGEDDDGISPS